MDLKKLITTIPDFPVKGIQYKDVTSILTQPKAFQHTVTKITSYCMKNKITDISALKGLTSLTKMDLKFNQITTLW